MSKPIRIIIFSLFTILIASCGAISRKDVMTQKVFISDIKTGKPLEGVQIIINKKNQGTTDKKGMYIHTLENINLESYYEIELKKPMYDTVNLKIYSKPGGQYVVGGIFLGFFGVIPMIISLGVDGGTGTWYTYTKKIKFKMIPSTQ